MARVCGGVGAGRSGHWRSLGADHSPQRRSALCQNSFECGKCISRGHTSRCPNAGVLVPMGGHKPTRKPKRKGDVQSNTRREVQTQKVHRPGLSRVADGWCVHGAKLFAFDLGRVTPPRIHLLAVAPVQQSWRLLRWTAERWSRARGAV